MLRGTQAYIQTKVSTVGQGEILILLYEGIIKFLSRAKQKIAEKDLGAKGIMISKALDIVNELDSSLNMEAGGSLAQNLHNLYMLCSARLLKANLTMDISIIDGVINVMSRLRDTYKEILNTPEARAATAQIESKLAKRTPTQRGMALPNMNHAPVPPVNPMHMQALYHQVEAQEAAQAPVQAAQPAAPVSTPAQQPAAVTAESVPFVTPVSIGSRRSSAAARYGKIANI